MTTTKRVDPAELAKLPCTGPSFDDLRGKLDPIVARYPQRAAALLPVLWVVQRARAGWLHPKSIREVAEYLAVPQAHVEGVITFYTMFKDQPVGRDVVVVCKTLSCRLRGAQEVMDALEDHFGIDMGGTTKDGRYTIETGECLGLCDMAPCMTIDEERHGNLTPESAVKTLEGRPR
ncbi:MAG: NADH-quinone oxidoreductase subunit NuoE [Planctomycetes bacterium]|nr:NADH-quinone oxidoreductase subunit NuoE [Planctomycetota bacterium]